MTQEELAARLELDTQYYAKLERGERNFTIEKIIRLCSILNVRIQDLVIIPSSPANNKDRILKLSSQMESRSPSQPLLVEKFMVEIIPFIK